MNTRRNIVTVMLLGLCSVAIVNGGCATRHGLARETPRRVAGAAEGQMVTSAELDELTRAFADRHVGLLYTVSDAIKKGNLDPVQRREATVLLVDASTNVYDIVSNADAFTRVLDLVVVTSLLTHVWVEDGRAAAVFGPRGDALAQAMTRASTEARNLAKRVLTDAHLSELDSLLRLWWEENPDMVRVSFIRFSNFAIGRGASAVSNVLAARGTYAEIGQAGQAVDEARLLAERMFYRLKREPTLLRWQAEAVKEDLLATQEFATGLADLNRLADQIEQLPTHLAAERQATLASAQDILRDVDATIANGRGALDEAHSLVAAMEPLGESLRVVIGTADALFARFEAWDRWRADTSTDTQPAPFDVREHAEAIKELAIAAEKINQMLATSDALLSSPAWDMRMQTVNESADGRITIAGDQIRIVLDALFWRVCALLGVLFAMLIVYRLLSLTLMKGGNRDDYRGGE